jgi:hypothetical protein
LPNEFQFAGHWKFHARWFQHGVISISSRQGCGTARAGGILPLPCRGIFCQPQPQI